MPRKTEPVSPVQKFDTYGGPPTSLVLERVVAWTVVNEGSDEEHLVVICEGGLSFAIIAEEEEFSAMVEEILSGEG